MPRRATMDSPARRAGPPGLKRAGLLATVFATGIVVGAAAQGMAQKAPAPGGTADTAESGVARTASAGGSAAEAVVTAATTAGEAAAAAARSDREASPVPPAAASVTGGAAPPAAGSSSQLATLDGRLVQLRNEIERLNRRVATLEQREPATVAVAATATPAELPDEPPPLPVSTPEDRYVALLSSGVDAERADDILERQARQELARLDLRDRATREGWADGEQYREAAAALRRNAVDLRGELGEDPYDRYLYNTGASNRVQITSVMQGSAAHDYGLQPGDVIEAYADSRVFDGRELRAATTRGVRGETVPVRIRRGDQIMEAWLPRGPIGIGLESVRVAPVP